MSRGLLVLTCIVLAACGGPVPTTSQQPTPTASPPATPGHTSTPAASSTPLLTDAPRPADADYWTHRADIAAGPAAREDHTWTVAQDAQTAYLFGGRTQDGPQADLWAFDLTTDIWTELQPTGPGPARRFGHTATWVPDLGLVVWSGQGSDFYSDLWVYDPAVDAWHELPSLGAVPAPRYGSCASLGPDGRLWISHGFTQDDGRFADTRAYDFATGEWTDMTPAGDVPMKRCLHDCFWTGSGKLVLYGGQTTGVAALADAWAYDIEGAAWAELPGNPQADAPSRQLYALAPIGADSARVFGGGSLEGGYLGDELVITSEVGVNVGWTIPAGPPGRAGATLIQKSNEHYLLFGGVNETGLLGDLWDLYSYWTWQLYP